MTIVIVIVGRAKAIRKRSKELIPNIMQRLARAITILEQYRKVVMQKLYKNEAKRLKTIIAKNILDFALT